MSKKRGQEEMVGFAIIIVLVAVVLLVFLAGFFPMIITYLWIVYLVLGILMISSIPIKKI